MAGPETLWDFEGLWRLDRQIDDRLGQGSGVLTGEAEFTRSDRVLIYRESGTLKLRGGGAFHATRRYVWHPSANGIEISFDDGRAFHSFNLKDPAPNAVHRCGPDTYRVAYDLRRWPVWTVKWDVTGARKGYVTTSHYARAA